MIPWSRAGHNCIALAGGTVHVGGMTFVPLFRRLFCLLVLGWGGSVLRAQGPGDEALVAHLQSRSRELQMEILQETDPARTAELQQELMELMDETLAKVTPPTRVMLELGMKVGRPIMEQGNAYMRQAAGFMDGAFDPVNWRKEGRLAEIRAALLELKTLNEALLTSIDGVEEHAKSIIAESDFPEKQKEEFLAGFMEPLNRQIGPMRAMRSLESKTYEEMDKLYRLLAERFDEWQVEPETGNVEWLNEDAQARFDEIAAKIQTYSERQQQAAQVMQQRL